MSKRDLSGQKIEALSLRLATLLPAYERARTDAFLASPGTPTFFDAVQREAAAAAEMHNMVPAWAAYRCTTLKLLKAKARLTRVVILARGAEVAPEMGLAVSLCDDVTGEIAA